MKKFEIGKIYRTRSVGDRNCIFELTIISRTEKTVKYDYEGHVKSSRIKINNNEEWIQPDKYSMAPIFKASKETV